MTRVPTASVDPSANGLDHAADLLAGDEGQRRLEGVGVPAHEDVGQPDGRGLDPDPEVAGQRLGLVDVDQAEHVGGLTVVDDLPRPHHGSLRVSNDGGSALPTGT